MASYNGTSTVTYIDPVAQQMALDRAVEQMADVAEKAREKSNGLAELASYTGMLNQTVKSGDTYATGSTIQLTRDTTAFDLKVWVGDEAHWFTFQTSPSN
jgi:hypothetical protein